jgi:thioredoxin reductase (NADPH)
MSEIHDLVIVGSGPAGYTAAIYAARAELKPILYEGSVTAGGALMNTTDVENFPGFPDGIMGPDLMDLLRKQAGRFGTKIITDDVVKMDLSSEIKVLVDGSGNTVKAKSVILATGSAYKEIGLTNEKRLSGRGVSWCATCDGFFFREKVIAVVGGGDSAMEEANFLTRFASKVYVIHRRDTLRASKIMIERARVNPKIEFIWNTEVIDVLGNEKVSGLKLRNLISGEESEREFDGLFVAIGHLPRSDLLVGQIDLDSQGYVTVEASSTRTNQQGVFACGDLVDHTYRQAITAARLLSTLKSF